MSITLEDIKRFRRQFEIQPTPVYNMDSSAAMVNIMMTPGKWLSLLDLAEDSLKHSCSEDAEEAFYEATRDQGW